MMSSENLSLRDVSQFNELASVWWDTKGPLKTLHHMNPLRVEFIAERVELDGKKICDVGCGGGILAESLSQCGAEVSGIDKAAEALSVAKMHAAAHQLAIQYEESTAEAYSQQYPHQFDVVTCLEMLEHVPHPETVVEACAKLVKPGGDLFFSTINRTPKAFLMAIIGAEYVLKLIPRSTHEYKKLIKPAELEHWLRSAGFMIQEISGVKYEPWNQQCSLTQDVSVNYIIHARADVTAKMA